MHIHRHSKIENLKTQVLKLKQYHIMHTFMYTCMHTQPKKIFKQKESIHGLFDGFSHWSSLFQDGKKTVMASVTCQPMQTKNKKNIHTIVDLTLSEFSYQSIAELQHLSAILIGPRWLGGDDIPSKYRLAHRLPSLWCYPDSGRFWFLSKVSWFVYKGILNWKLMCWN